MPGSTASEAISMRTVGAARAVLRRQPQVMQRRGHEDGRMGRAQRRAAAEPAGVVMPGSDAGAPPEPRSPFCGVRQDRLLVPPRRHSPRPNPATRRLMVSSSTLPAGPMHSVHGTPGTTASASTEPSEPSEPSGPAGQHGFVPTVPVRCHAHLGTAKMGWACGRARRR
jgi:hypothetical protein